MVGIKKEDRDVLRFLWFESPNECHPKLTVLRFTRLVFGLRPSPSILGSTISHHLQSYQQSEPKMVNLLQESFYVDDLVTGEESVEASFQIYKKSKQIMAEGGFNLRKWNSNLPELLEQIAVCEVDDTHPSHSDTTPDQVDRSKACEEDESYAKSTTGHNAAELSHGGVKVLGINWDTKSDKMYFNFDQWSEDVNSLPATKRSLLTLTAKIFDPLGFLTPFVILMKILFQILCVDKIGWDEELKGDLLTRFQSTVSEIKFLHSVQVPRCYFNVYTKPRQIELHGFSDASRRAYAAAVYIRSVYDGGSVQVQLVASKSRVAPIKEQSIPRLELLGAVILARLCSKIKATIGELDTTYWVDSMTTLCWIKNEKHWKQYVQHRVEEIRRLSPRHAWRYCPGPMNPADLPSRGVSAKELSSKKSWWNGPEFLLTPPSEWPPDDPSTRVNDQALQEAAKFSPTITHSMVNKETNNPEKGVDQIIQVEQYSSLQRLLRVTATVLRFIRRLKMRVAGKLDLTTTTNRDVEDMRSSEVLWIKAIQRSSFQDEMEFLSEGESKGAKNLL